VNELHVIVVCFNNAETIEDCLTAAQQATAGLSSQITVVDNSSSDNTAEIVESRFPSVELIALDNNIGFGAANNLVLRRCGSTFVLLLNPDTRIASDAVGVLLKTLMQHPRVALAGPRMQYEDGVPQVSFGSFPGLLSDARQRRFVRAVKLRRQRAVQRLEKLLTRPFTPGWVSGSCFLARTQALREVDFFDTDFFLYLEDVDLCRRLKSKGWRVMVAPEARCVHVEGASQPSFSDTRRYFRRSRLLYANKHGGRLGFELYRLLRARDSSLRYDSAKRFSGGRFQ